MEHLASELNTTPVTAKKNFLRKSPAGRMAPPTNGEILVKGVVMGIIISGITHASKSIGNALVRHPLTLFGTGFVTGYLVHKYRKEILLIGNQTAEESKNFVLRQTETLGDLLLHEKQGSDVEK